MKKITFTTVLALVFCNAALFAQSEITAQKKLIRVKNLSGDMPVKTMDAPARTRPMYVSVVRHVPNPIIDNEIIEKKTSPVPLKAVELKIYPNPVVKDLSLTVSDAKMSASVYEAVMYDLQGKKVFSQYLNSNHSSLDLASLANGIYMVHIMKNGNTIKQEKIIKE